MLLKSYTNLVLLLFYKVKQLKTKFEKHSQCFFCWLKKNDKIFFLTKKEVKQLKTLNQTRDTRLCRAKHFNKNWVTVWFFFSKCFLWPFFFANHSFPFPVSRFPFPVSRFPFPVSRFPFPVSRFPFPFYEKCLFVNQKGSQTAKDKGLSRLFVALIEDMLTQKGSQKAPFVSCFTL